MKLADVELPEQYKSRYWFVKDFRGGTRGNRWRYYPVDKRAYYIKRVANTVPYLILIAITVLMWSKPQKQQLYALGAFVAVLLVVGSFLDYRTFNPGWLLYKHYRKLTKEEEDSLNFRVRAISASDNRAEEIEQLKQVDEILQRRLKRP